MDEINLPTDLLQAMFDTVTNKAISIEQKIGYLEMRTLIKMMQPIGDSLGNLFVNLHISNDCVKTYLGTLTEEELTYVYIAVHSLESVCKQIAHVKAFAIRNLAL
jgi:hypothetical protein